MTDRIREALSLKAIQLAHPDYARSQIMTGNNPLDVSEIEVLLQNHDNAWNYLLELLTDRDTSVDIINVILLLLNKQDAIPTSYVDPLCSLLERRDARLLNEDIIEILGEIGDERAVPCLIRVVHDIDFPHLDENYWPIIKAITSLSEIGGPVAIEGIREAMRHDSAVVRDEAVRYVD